MKKTFNHYKKIIIDNIDLSPYGIEHRDNFNNIQEVDKIFRREYGWALNRMSYQKAFSELL